VRRELRARHRRHFRENCIKRYKQYRSFSRFRDVWTKAGPNDKDGMLYDEKQHWGAQLHIPLSFRTIEAMVPRAIAHRPRMLYLPRSRAGRPTSRASGC
jgi:hypothetical protein